MFKRRTQETSNKPLNSLMLQVESYVESPNSKVVDTVIGRDLEGKAYSIILTTTGAGADNTKRNTIESFTKPKSNHHVPVGGMILLSTVWARESEKEGEPATGIARWAEFFGNSRDELIIGNAMYRAGTNVDPKGGETRWAAVDRMTRPVTLESVEQFHGAVVALADKCAADRARARPVVRLMNAAGEVQDYTELKQGSAEVEIDGEKVRRAETGEQMLASISKNTRLAKMLEAAEKGEGTLEMLPVMSVEMSKKMMNSPRGTNYIALAKRFSDTDQQYAAECYIRRAPADEFNYISHLAVTNTERFDPLLLASERFPNPAYGAELLKELGIEGKAASQQTPTPEMDEQQMEQHAQQEYDEAPGFAN